MVSVELFSSPKLEKFYVVTRVGRKDSQGFWLFYKYRYISGVCRACSYVFHGSLSPITPCKLKVNPSIEPRHLIAIHKLFPIRHSKANSNWNLIIDVHDGRLIQSQIPIDHEHPLITSSSIFQALLSDSFPNRFNGTRSLFNDFLKCFLVKQEKNRWREMKERPADWKEVEFDRFWESWVDWKHICCKKNPSYEPLSFVHK